MARLSNDHGRTADRVASIEPLELHRAVCTAAIHALSLDPPSWLWAATWRQVS